MAFSIWKLFKKEDKIQRREVAINELYEAGVDWQVRELCYWACINLIANAMGRCEVRTYEEGREVHGREYWTWNYEPNVNQTSTAFWHKFIARLYERNEALIIMPRKRDGYDSFIVADEWDEPRDEATRAHIYRNVKAGDQSFDQSFREGDVIHVKLNHVNMAKVNDAMYRSWWRLCRAAMKAFQFEHGQHWKVHVDQVASGQEGWAASFQEMISTQLKPFLESDAAVLPEFDGYAYSNAGGGDKSTEPKDLRALVEDIFTFTCRAFGIPYVLIAGGVEATGDAQLRMLSGTLDPICDQLSEEITRKRYSFEDYQAGTYVTVASSGINHFDIFDQAGEIVRLVGSGAYSINDIRKAAGEEPIPEPWADAHYMTKNIGALESGEQK